MWQRSSLAADLKGASESDKKRRPKEENIKEQVCIVYLNFHVKMYKRKVLFVGDTVLFISL